MSHLLYQGIAGWQLTCMSQEGNQKAFFSVALGGVVPWMPLPDLFPYFLLVGAEKRRHSEAQDHSGTLCPTRTVANGDSLVLITDLSCVRCYHQGAQDQGYMEPHHAAVAAFVDLTRSKSCGTDWCWGRVKLLFGTYIPYQSAGQCLGCSISHLVPC